MPTQTKASKERSPVEVLEAARERISDPERWCQHSFRDADGRVCALAALGEQLDLSSADLVIGAPTYAFLFEAMGAAGGTSVGKFNDSHTHPEVLAAFDHAIELAKAAA